MANSGDIEEIESLYRRYGPALQLFATTIAGDRSRAEDALHQVFLKLIQSDSLGRAADKKAYLFACVRNAILNEAKVQARNTGLDPDAAWFLPVNRDYGAELNLRRALCVLPKDQQQVVVLHLWGELTFSQIGELLQISANTAASRYRYALARLRESMCAKEASCAKS